MSMQFLIVAGGASSRLQPIPDKNLLSFFGETLIGRQLRIIEGLDNFDSGVIVGSPSNIDAIKEATNNWKEKFKIEYVIQPEPKGWEDAMLCAAEHITEEPLLLVAGADVVRAEAYRDLLSVGDDVFALLLAKKQREYFPGGYIVVDGENNIKELVERPEEGSQPSDLVNIVLHGYANGVQLIEVLKKTLHTKGDKNHFATALDSLIAGGDVCRAVPYEGEWNAIKYPWYVLDMMRAFFEHEAPEPHVSKKATIAKTAVINGTVWIEDDVKIFDGAIINGPVYLGKGAVVANNALVRESHIGERSVVGYGTEIARSYVGTDVWTHSNYVGDSVICDDVSLGAGTVLGNLRLDEENVKVHVGEPIDTGRNKLGAFIGPRVRIGINCSLMPGVRIGADSFVSGGVLVHENIQSGQFVQVKQEHTVRDNMKQITTDRSDFLNKLQ